MEERLVIATGSGEAIENGVAGAAQADNSSGAIATGGEEFSSVDLVNGDQRVGSCPHEDTSRSVAISGNDSNCDDRGDGEKELGDCGSSLDSNSYKNEDTDVADKGEAIDRSSPLTEETGGEINSPRKEDAKDEKLAVDSRTVNGNVLVTMIGPHSLLPKPEAPQGIKITCSPTMVNRSKSMPEAKDDFDFDMPAIGKFIREKSNSLSAAITKRLSSSLKETKTCYDDSEVIQRPHALNGVTEFNLSGLQVIVKLKNDHEIEGERIHYKGRVSFFSRSNCRDCTAVRSYLRDMELNFVEINIDVFPMREKELVERTGSASVPQIFFNEKPFGGLVALNSLRNTGTLEHRLKELLANKCPDDAPAPPLYGFDDPEEERMDEMIEIVRVLRQRLPIQDRFTRMKIVKNCFSGAETVEILIQHMDCGRKKAVEIGKQIARKHFIHHVFGENEFEDGNHFYRFLEHEPFISRCYNFRGSTNDCEPKAIAFVSQRLTKIMDAILESYASDDRCHLDYVGISKSEEFRRYLNLVQELQRINVLALSSDERLAFFINLYNAMVIHAVIKVGHPEGVNERRLFYSHFHYIVGGQSYSLTTIKDGILRSNRRAPYSVVKPFGSGDSRLELAFPKGNPLIHFGLCNGTRSSPPVRFFTHQAIESELKYAAREFFQRDGLDVDLTKRTVYLSNLFKLYSADFGQEKEMLKWIIKYVDSAKAGLLTHLLGDCGPVNVVYKNYDWSLNS